MEKPDGRRPLGKHGSIREGNNKMHLREEGWKDIDNVTNGRWPFVNTVIKLRVPYNMGKLVCSETSSLSSKPYLHGVC
jgi:hypothetical protein